MERIPLAFVVAFVVRLALGAGGLALAQRYQGPETVKQLSERDIVETVDGKPARVTTQVTGPIFGYVLEGELEFALDDESPTRLKAGETFYEPSGVVPSPRWEGDHDPGRLRE